ncbi:hypothetical protein [Acinetobacter sp. B51(2017)]|uniref:hypothetical protein n=1 Tax=Acinetobacter sp. B51(2017) TaxID=2060938 RepID=UPI0013E09BAB|nr:hypothetical protein [Acinetobacter sp. B51(2017)]
MLKVGAILLVIVGAILVLGLIYISFKMLRQTQQQQREQGVKKDYQLHPKLQEDLDKNNKK